MVLRTCEAGLRALLTTTPVTPAHALVVLSHTPADVLSLGFCGSGSFRRWQTAVNRR